MIFEGTFYEYKNVKTVILADTVRRNENGAFSTLISLEFVRLSTNLEYIGKAAFCWCARLQTIFIPPSCTEIGDYAFWASEKFIIFSFPFQTLNFVRVLLGVRH